MTPPHDVVAVGNAIVDILAQASDDFLARHEIVRGAMTLIDEARADFLTGLFPDPIFAAGGSAANSVTGVASLGGSAAYIGKVADDALGARFIKEFRAGGVAFDSAARPGPPSTARCIIAVSPDGQRSMNTYLGASTLLEPADVVPSVIQSGAIVFLEGYLFDRDEAKAAFVRAAEIAKAAGRRVALTTSDVFCVERHRTSFRHLVAGHIDVLLANEGELLSLYETASLTEALAAARADCPVVAVTRSAQGSIVADAAGAVEIAAEPVAQVVDTTGAGDLYAAGFLFGLSRGRPLAECGKLGAIAAGEVISHMGPRPETRLDALVRAAGL
ncbi:MAG: adenosine kinase [Hyphomonadaceae bacterium]|nr:adenosine kinase [Hyphomonadaceae bacterium]